MGKCNSYTLAGIIEDCASSLAGVDKIWIGYFGDFNIQVAESAHSVTSMSAATGAETGKLYGYEFPRQTASLTTTLTTNEEAGTRYYTSVVSMVMNKLRAEVYLELEALAEERLVVIVKDNNGICHLLGAHSYVKGTAETAATGQSFDDANQATIELSSTDGHYPYIIDEAKFSGLIA